MQSAGFPYIENFLIILNGEEKLGHCLITRINWIECMTERGLKNIETIALINIISDLMN